MYRHAQYLRTIRILVFAAVLIVSLLAIARVSRADSYLPPLVYISPAKAGQTEDGIVYGREDILELDRTTKQWHIWLDGSAVGLKPEMHNINAFAFGDWYFNYSDPMYLSFSGSPVYVPDIPAKVYPQDVVRFTFAELSRAAGETSFYMWIDGSDIGLNLVSEAIDGLSWFAAQESDFFGPECGEYGMFAISTVGRYVVPAAGGGWLKGPGSDVLVFCPTQVGYTTAGVWYKIFDSTAAGVTPRNAIDSIKLEYLEDMDDTVHADFSFAVKRPMSAPGISANPSDIVYREDVHYPDPAYYDNWADLNGEYPRLNGTIDALDYLWIE